MGNSHKYENRIFGLDIGTRSIVGTVGYKDSGNKFIVEAICIKEHETRAMLDGQIHDVEKVTEAIVHVKNELEKKLEMNLEDVCIAAAGRVLKTITVDASRDFNEDTIITDEHVYALDMLAAERAYAELRNQLYQEDTNFYCVGYSPVKYTINGYQMLKLQGHRGNSISVELLATFLPVEVIEDLYTAVEAAGLNVVNLTLEPIAAINVAIPEKFRLLNIALVDVGAGTSDICITKDGSIIAYGMIPCAGDEITEFIAHKYLLEFNEAERIKVEASTKEELSFEDVMGINKTISSTTLIEEIEEGYTQVTKKIADRIIELNGEKAVSAVFVVGGGGKLAGFVQSLAEYLGIAEERVALRGKEVLKEVKIKDKNVTKDSTLVTPIGISLNYYENRNHFVHVMVNNTKLKMFNTNRLSVTDVAIQLGLSMNKLFAQRGRNIYFVLNEKEKVIKGEGGEHSTITVNGKPAGLGTLIKNNDVIFIEESTIGQDASITVGELNEFKPFIKFVIDGKNVEFIRLIKVNGDLVGPEYVIQEDDNIELLKYYRVSQLMEYMGLDCMEFSLTVDGRSLFENEKVYENANISLMKRIHESDEEATDTKEEEDALETLLYEQLEEDHQKEIEKLSEVRFTDDNFGYNEGFEYEDYSDLDLYDYQDEYYVKEKNYTQEGSASVTMKPDGLRVSELKDGISNLKREMTVMVNGSPVKLSDKSKYIFVDILEVYPFDRQTLGGTKLIMNVNSKKADFTTPIHENDVIELYWI